MHLARFTLRLIQELMLLAGTAQDVSVPTNANAPVRRTMVV